ncbi:MAG: MFS transporter [Myxococcales bacterium]|nr:MFS transporter [Myxococcales bacterium]MCB9734081.1 MFS transporter [Deltaproteobacteria bacterium]
MTAPRAASPRRALAAALLGFFIITLDALVVSVALPAIGDTFDAGMTGLQWVMDGYTLPFAALLLLAGTLSDRLGARRAFGAGLIVFIASSAACAFAPSLGVLVAARVAQGAGAALMTPASLSLIGEAYPDPVAKARAIGLWAVGGAVASTSGPLVGGAMTAISWRLIFLVNLPVGAVALWLLAGIPRSRRREVAYDVPGQILAVVALTALTYGLIEAGADGLGRADVIAALAVAGVGAAAFFALQAKSAHPMVPLRLFRSRAAATTVAIGFTFMVGFYGMVFLMSLLLQERRGMSPFAAGLAFLPVTGFSLVMPIVAARMAERFGAWVPIALGQLAMATGLLALAAVADTAPVPLLVALMVPVGFGAGTAMPSATSLLLNTVPHERSGTASGVLNTSRQVGGATAIAAFGGLVAALGYDGGTRLSLGLAGGLLALTMLATLRLRRAG